MSHIEFSEEGVEEGQFTSRRILGEPVRPKMIIFLIEKGIVKNEKHAGYILLGFTILVFAASLFFFASATDFRSTTPPSSGPLPTSVNK